MPRGLLLALSLLVFSLAPFAHGSPVVVASKQFTESHVLAEIVAGLLQQEGVAVERKMGLGGSLVVYNALRAGEVDLYPDYTGTLAQSLLGKPHAHRQELIDGLAGQGLEIIVEFGFNNRYALSMTSERAEALGVHKISDLRRHPELRPAFSLEFLNRKDGWIPLSQLYGLRQSVRGIEHALGYQALERGQADIIDAYTTDGELLLYDLRQLEDDLGFFPRYDAVLLGRQELAPELRKVLLRLQSRLEEEPMQQLNALARDGDSSPRQVAREFLAAEGLIAQPGEEIDQMLGMVLSNTVTHIKLTLIALLIACSLAIPLGLLLAHHPRRSASAVYVAGLLQTVPSLAMLALLIPVLGLGQVPAIVALCLYSLLPILRNTLTGLAAVDPLLKEVADGMGLTGRQRLLKVEVPLALPTILAGIKTAAIISIGTATLAAFVGAGGLGEPIITGLTLNDHALILQGAIPAALLAIVTEFLFEWLERVIVPAHLRQQLA